MWLLGRAAAADEIAALAAGAAVADPLVHLPLDVLSR